MVGRHTKVSIVLIAALMSGCATNSPRESSPACTGLRGWTDGQLLQAASGACTKNDDYQEAWRLGNQASTFTKRIADLDAEIMAFPERTNLLRRERRQVQNDLEAIRAVAVVQGWLPAQDCSGADLCDPADAASD